MLPSRGMGDIRKSKMPKAKTGRRKDGDTFTTYKDGGKVKSRVNEAGVYTKPSMRKKLFEQIKGSATHGTKAGEWSGRKAQLLAKKYKEKGGGYRG
jgi:hypothetical protein